MPPAASDSHLPAIGELELASLTELWRTGESDVSEVHQAVGKERGITSNTVGSALERLHRKGLVCRHKVSHAFRYRPAITADEFAARRVLEASGGSGALSRVGVLAAFVDLVADVDDGLLDRLEVLIAKKRRPVNSAAVRKRGRK
jgi:predicted transcriptional regulator